MNSSWLLSALLGETAAPEFLNDFEGDAIRQPAAEPPLELFSSTDTSASYGGGVQVPKPSLKLRDYFPETWLWTIELVGSEGSVVKDEKLPHTVTEWVGSAICSNKKHGFGISNVARIKAFQPFFIQFTMPYSVKRGEKMPLKVSIFNHMDHDMPISVTLDESMNFDVADDGTNVYHLCLKKSDSEVVTFNLTFAALGDINVTVEAATNPTYEKACGPETILAFQ
ncbi:unnamed protein product [Notodromas monacha]|uniref:Alpha-2-macroglobulin domain-containing protein n=1 Tax=Notodromas monacha TaxID=399045 RepID=A0A7R9BY80_9CRUS|nr:unnamed protein product [Notodromas monacha]CAG0922329.1 unnamed protein product [Notodromas monacha]